MRFSNLVIGAFFIALAIGIIFLSAGFDASAGQRFGPGLFPTCTALLMGAAGSALFIKALLQREVRPWVELADWWREKRLVLNGASIFVTLFLYLFFSEVVGFLILVPLLLWGLIALLWGRVWTALVIGVLASLGIHLFFVELLKVPLPWGLVPYFKLL